MTQEESGGRQHEDESTGGDNELRILPDGRVELLSDRRLVTSPLYNHDLAPVALSDRNWSTYNFAALWAAMSACIPTYMLSSGLIASGMNWWQALFTILLGNVIVLAPILANSHPGTKYGIPFPVLARASYGTIGSNLPALMRALVACGWFGIQSWIGGQALFMFIKALYPGFGTVFGPPVFDHTLGEWISFAIFWGLNMLVVFRGMDLLKKIGGIAAPFVVLMTLALTIWAIQGAHGLGGILNEKTKLSSLAEFLPVFFPSLTAMIGFWATLSLNVPDFTRFGKSQKEQLIGQSVALPLTMTLFSAMGVIITSSAVVIYPDVPLSELWDPVKLVGRFNEPALVAIAMFTITVATLSVNIAANVVSPANDFANVFPKVVDFKRGGIITGVLGLLLQPWRLIADPSGYIFKWLLGYSGGLGSIAGVMIVDYWLVRKTKLSLPDLYLKDGAYTYDSGWNPAAITATVIGCMLAWSGLFIDAMKPLYDYAWFVGLAVSGGLYYVLMRYSHTADDAKKDS